MTIPKLFSLKTPNCSYDNFHVSYNGFGLTDTVPVKKYSA